MPLILKGILDPADAEQAVEIAANGLVASNHGARNLDTLPATIDALPAVAESAGSHAAIILDGGIRRGTDALKSLPLGATAVMIGRTYVLALATAGAAGVALLSVCSETSSRLPWPSPGGASSARSTAP
jgi:4-hydroxymandelate oxidase